MHTLWDCTGFWELVATEAQCWLALLKTLGMGFGLVVASTQVLGLLELAAFSFYEKLTDPWGPRHEALQPAPLLGPRDGYSS